MRLNQPGALEPTRGHLDQPGGALQNLNQQGGALKPKHGGGGGWGAFKPTREGARRCG